MSFDPGDVDLIRTLPRIALATGYVDVMQAYPGLPMRDGVLRRELGTLAPELQALVALFALASPVDVDALERILGAPLVAALERFRVLLRDDHGEVQTAGLCLIPHGGDVVFVPAPRDAPVAVLGDDTLALVARLAPRPEAHCLALGAGPGMIVIGLARRAHHVVAIEPQLVALACTELNVVMNALDDRVTLRSGFALDAVEPGEQYDHIAANPPPLPFPAELFDAEAGTALEAPIERMTRALPTLLRDGGVAQLIGADLGGEHGPRTLHALDEIAASHALASAITVTCTAPLGRGSRLLASLAANAARAGVIPSVEAERRMLEHLERTRCDRLHLFAVTVSRGLRPAGVTVSRPDEVGGGYWTR